METSIAESVGGTADLEEVAQLSQAPGPQFSPEEHRAKATKLLALLLFCALVAICVAHIVCILCLAHNKPNAVEEVSRVFNTWIPVFSGLFGSAATFYFTQGRK
jgi:threonine/homoserine/homoserine lactone efflux protein